VREVLSELDRLRAGGGELAIATVIDARRSAPRPVGAKMVIARDGGIGGSVSGGCVEGAVVQAAEEVLGGAPPRLMSFGIADETAWSVGLPCGGEIDVWVSRYQPTAFERLAREGQRGVQVTLLEGAGAGASLLVGLEGRIEGTLGSPELDAEAERVAGELIWGEHCERRGALFFDVTAPDPRLILFGAVDIAAAVCRLARDCSWRPYVVDPRARFATPERFPDALEVIAAWPAEAFEQLGGIDPATSIAVLTHDPKLDDAALLIALRSPARFVGAMGSRRAQEARRERLLAAGVTEEELARLSAPLGLDLGATGREETALSILAEVVAARHGRDGGRLRDRRGRIHEVPAGETVSA
jgi:xanthine dehydrogenase accessory factor